MQDYKMEQRYYSEIKTCDGYIERDYLNLYELCFSISSQECKNFKVKYITDFCALSFKVKNNSLKQIKVLHNQDSKISIKNITIIFNNIYDAINAKNSREEE